MTGTGHNSLHEDRYARLRAIQWWDQEKLAAARVLVVGAGALGNEVIKNLALMGIGALVIVDLDVVEESNLSRSVLFRENDVGLLKADCAAAAVGTLNPDVTVHPLCGDVMLDLGLGTVRQADVIIGALDNREARVHLNKACTMTGRPWIDGGIEALSGIVRSFHPPGTACYECTMGAADWAELDQKRSCSLMARLALTNRGTPTTPLSASFTGAFQALEAVKLIHGMDNHLGRGFRLDASCMDMISIEYPANKDCFCRSGPLPVLEGPALSSNSSLADILHLAAAKNPAIDTLELGRDFVTTLSCPSCGTTEQVNRSAGAIPAGQLLCATCSEERDPAFAGAVGPGHPLLDSTPRKLDLPNNEIFWTRSKTEYLGVAPGGDIALWPPTPERDT